MNYKEQCKAYGLDATPEFWETPESEIEYIYNGAGPDWLPEKYRKFLTELLDLFETAFVIHDFDFSKSDKSEKGFKIANDRLLKNMKIIIGIEYPFWSDFPDNMALNIRWRLRARGTYIACRDFGWSAWLD